MNIPIPLIHALIPFLHSSVESPRLPKWLRVKVMSGEFLNVRCFVNYFVRDVFLTLTIYMCIIPFLFLTGDCVTMSTVAW